MVFLRRHVYLGYLRYLQVCPFEASGTKVSLKSKGTPSHEAIRIFFFASSSVRLENVAPFPPTLLCILLCQQTPRWFDRVGEAQEQNCKNCGVLQATVPLAEGGGQVFTTEVDFLVRVDGVGVDPHAEALPPEGLRRLPAVRAGVGRRPGLGQSRSALGHNWRFFVLFENRRFLFFGKKNGQNG